MVRKLLDTCLILDMYEVFCVYKPSTSFLNDSPVLDRMNTGWTKSWQAIIDLIVRPVGCFCHRKSHAGLKVRTAECVLHQLSYQAKFWLMKSLGGFVRLFLPCLLCCIPDTSILMAFLPQYGY